MHHHFMPISLKTINYKNSSHHTITEIFVIISTNKKLKYITISKTKTYLIQKDQNILIANTLILLFLVI